MSLEPKLIIIVLSFPNYGSGSILNLFVVASQLISRVNEVAPLLKLVGHAFRVELWSFFLQDRLEQICYRCVNLDTLISIYFYAS